LIEFALNSIISCTKHKTIERNTNSELRQIVEKRVAPKLNFNKPIDEYMIGQQIGQHFGQHIRANIVEIEPQLNG